MANVTDPLAANLHGTDPQNLLEYIVRQKIYDTRYWKEECFGLTAADILEKASLLKCLGASYGGNAQPTKFLCLLLKILQIQPPMGGLIISIYIQQEEFKYVRCLGAIYLRLCGRPAEIYETLEPLYRDYRKLKYRGVTEWSLLHVDEFIHQLLHDERVCGIALPRLPLRQLLVDEGYLENEQYQSPLYAALDVPPSDVTKQVLEDYLSTKVQLGSKAAKVVAEQRKSINNNKKSVETTKPVVSKGDSGVQSYYGPASTNEEDKEEERYSRGDDKDGHPSEPSESRKKRNKKKDKKEAAYGLLFKKSKRDDKPSSKPIISSIKEDNKVEENSEEYWNEQRAKLGLKPLKQSSLTKR